MSQGTMKRERAEEPSQRVAISGAGLGLRPELNADLLLQPRAVDFVEVVVEACFASPQARREAAAMAEFWPVIPHGIKLSLGSADGIEVERASRLGELARELRAPVVTEHVAFVRGGSREIGHLTPLPYTRDAVKIVAKNVAEARRRLPDIPLLLENIAWTFRWSEDAMAEADFYGEIVSATGCGMLLDLGNLYANALNEGRDPKQVLLNFPLEYVGMVHLAGGVHEHGFYLDTHAHTVPDTVFELLDILCERRGRIPVILERDSLFPPFVELEKEVQHIREIQAPYPPAYSSNFNEIRDDSNGDHNARLAMLEAQRKMAQILTSQGEPSPEDVAPFGARAIVRTREILKRKRVEDALPLLPRLLQWRALLEPIAYRSIADTPRTAQLAAIADAIRIARGAEEHPMLLRAALLDGLVLEARFCMEDHTIKPRRSPFLRRRSLPNGQNCWIIKGPGIHAGVRLLEPPPQSTEGFGV